MSDWDAYYQTRFRPDPKRTVVWKCIANELQSELPHDATVVEFGAGYCDFINNIRAARKIAIDVSTAVSQAAAPGVEVHIASCTECGFLADGIADTIFTSNLLEHLTLTDATAALREAWRILKPGGRLIIVQPNFRYCYREYFDDYTHITIYTDVSLADFVASIGFKLTRLEPRFMPFSMKGNLPIAAWLIRLYLRSPFKPRAGQMLLVASKEV